MKNDPLSPIRCFLLDMDGTFYLGERPLPGAARFIDVLTTQGKDFLFLTNNSSKHRGLYAEKISRMGVPIPDSKVFTSGEATALYLRKPDGPTILYVVGTPALEEEFCKHGYTLDEESPQAVVLGFDTTLTYAKLWKLCDFVRAGLPYIATHPDFNCPTETGFMPDIGAIIAFVMASTGREPDVIIGKPNHIIVDMVARKLNLPLSSLAMIGDRLYTDIALGSTSGITTVLVLSGETRLEDLKDSAFQPTVIEENLGTVADRLSKLDE
jgi:4-nitrophenyl phosphatase